MNEAETRAEHIDLALKFRAQQTCFFSFIPLYL